MILLKTLFTTKINTNIMKKTTKYLNIMLLQTEYLFKVTEKYPQTVLYTNCAANLSNMHPQ